MKVRTGFVSNSSSSSFVCIGMKISLETFLRNKDAIKESDLQYCAEVDWWDCGEDVTIFIGIIKYDGDSIVLPYAVLTLGANLHGAGLVDNPLHPILKAYGGECDYANPLDQIGEGFAVDDILERIKNEN